MRLPVLFFALCIIGCGGDSGSGSGPDMAIGGGGNTGGNGGTSGGGGNGGTSGGGGHGGMTGNGGSSGGPFDMAGATGSFVCGNMTCPTGTECCVTGTTPACATSCPGGFVADCAKPADCTTGDACCVTAQAALQPMFSVKIENVSCAPLAACVPSVDGTLKVLTRACTTDSDCTTDGKGGSNNTMYPNCCTNMGQHVCFKNQQPLPAGWTCP
jgi:hypothetical protein